MCFFSCLLYFLLFFFFNDTATTEIYTLSLHDALPISRPRRASVPTTTRFSGSPSRRCPACPRCPHRSGSPRAGSRSARRSSGRRTRTTPQSPSPSSPRMSWAASSRPMADDGVMFAIGDFARHGRVSVRMLRHYDAIGLLRPAHVDPATGYRSYTAGQLARLNRIVALKDLGFTLEQVRAILDDKVGIDELRGMLRLRQAELQSQIATDSARLAQVEARLQIIEREGAMPADDVQIKRIPGIRAAELTGNAT